MFSTLAMLGRVRLPDVQPSLEQLAKRLTGQSRPPPRPTVDDADDPNRLLVAPIQAGVALGLGQASEPTQHGGNLRRRSDVQLPDARASSPAGGAAAR